MIDNIPSNSLAMLLTSAKAKLTAYIGIVILAVLLVFNPTLFYLSVVALLVVGSVYIPYPIDEALRPALAQRFEQAAGWVIVFVAALWMATSAGFPKDDLLRHIQAAGWEFDYVDHYDHHIFPTRWSWSIGFDVVVGAIHGISHDVLLTSRVVRSLETVFLGTVLLLAVKRATPAPSLRFLALAVALLGLVWPRLQLGRPEIVLAGLVFAATFASRKAWLVLFTLLMPFHAFSAVYAASAFLLGSTAETLRTRAARNAGVAVLAILIAIGFWLAYTRGEFVTVLPLLNTVLKIQAATGMRIGELLPLIVAMSSTTGLLVLAGLLAVVWYRSPHLASNPVSRNEVLLLLGLAAYFSLPNYVRYAPVVWSLLVIAALVANGKHSLPGLSPAWLWVAGVAFTAYNIAPRLAEPPAEVLAALRVADRSRILAPFTTASYLATAANPTAIVTPIFDLSTVTQPARDVVWRLTTGSLRCGDLASLNVDVVIENTLTGPPPPCLRLVNMHSGYHVWSIQLLE